MKPWVKYSGALIGAATLAGCSTLQPPVRQIAVDSNRVFAESADQQTFLNILRAKDKLPTHYSSFAFFRGNLEVRSTAGLGASLVERGTSIVTNDVTGTSTIGGTVQSISNGVDTFTPSLGISTASNPNFEVRVYDSKEFQSGILTPIKPSLFDFYLGQGWPDQVLSALFISSVDITFKLSGANKGETLRLVNDPSTSPDGPNFGIFIDFFETTHRQGKEGETALFKVDLVKDMNLEDLATLDGRKFNVKRNKLDTKSGKKTYENCELDELCVVRVTPPSRGITFKVRDDEDDQKIGEYVSFPGKAIQSKIVSFLAESRKTQALEEGLWIKCDAFSIIEDESGRNKTQSEEARAQEGFCDVGIASDESTVVPIGTLEFEVLFRSPESVIYFLGKYIRENVDGGAYRITEGECDYPLIVVKNSVNKDDLLTARHRGKSYGMPPPGNRETNCGQYHRGPQAITIAQQLINLHKSADSLPVTSAIQIVP